MSRESIAVSTLVACLLNTTPRLPYPVSRKGDVMTIKVSRRHLKEVMFRAVDLCLLDAGTEEWIEEIVRPILAHIRGEARMAALELIADRKLCIGFGGGPGSGEGAWLRPEWITPDRIVHIVERRPGVKLLAYYRRTSYDGQYGAETFLAAFDKAVDEALKSRRLFEFNGRFYTEEVDCEKAKAEFRAARRKKVA